MVESASARSRGQGLTSSFVSFCVCPVPLRFQKKSWYVPILALAGFFCFSTPTTTSSENFTKNEAFKSFHSLQFVVSLPSLRHCPSFRPGRAYLAGFIIFHGVEKRRNNQGMEASRRMEREDHDVNLWELSSQCWHDNYFQGMSMLVVDPSYLPWSFYPGAHDPICSSQIPKTHLPLLLI